MRALQLLTHSPVLAVPVWLIGLIGFFLFSPNVSASGSAGGSEDPHEKSRTVSTIFISLGGFQGGGSFGDAMITEPGISLGGGFGLRKGSVGIRSEVHFTRLHLIGERIVYDQGLSYVDYEMKWSSVETAVLGEYRFPTLWRGHDFFAGVGVLMTISHLRKYYTDDYEFDPGITVGVRMENQLAGSTFFHTAFRYVKTFDDSPSRIEYYRLDFGLAYRI